MPPYMIFFNDNFSVGIFSTLSLWLNTIDKQVHLILKIGVLYTDGSLEVFYHLRIIITVSVI